MKKLLVILLIPLTLILLVGANVKPPEEANLPTSTVAPAQSTHTFAVISDIHSDLKSLQKALDKARADGVGFIIIVGDLTTVGSEKELGRVKSILDASGFSYFVVPGNHDLWSKGGVNNFKAIFGPDFQSFQKGETKFILIDNGNGVRGLGEPQQNWLNQELADCLRLYCLIFGHMPLNHPYLTHVMGEDNAVVASQAAELVKKLTSYQVKKLFAGHVHYFSSYELDGLKTHTDGAIFSDKETASPRFLEITVSGLASPPGGPEIKLEEKEVWVE